MSFQITSDWNKAPAGPGPKTELWTKDGLALNQLLLVGDIRDGEPLFRQSSRELPMPNYQSDMLPNEIAELFETSMTNIQGGQVNLETSNLRPQQLSDSIAFRFNVDYFTLEGLAMRGDVLALPFNDRLYLAAYIAASIHYFDKDAGEIDRLFSTLTVAN